MLGAVVALLSGVVHPGDIPAVWQIVWNATTTCGSTDRHTENYHARRAKHDVSDLPHY